METTILDPTLDKEGKYINQFVKEMVEEKFLNLYTAT
jgi:hypothetical protein